MRVIPGFLRIGIKKYLRPIKTKTFDTDERDVKKFIHAIVIKDNIKAIKDLIVEGADANAKCRFGGNPVYWAARYKQGCKYHKSPLRCGSKVNMREINTVMLCFAKPLLAATQKSQSFFWKEALM